MNKLLLAAMQVHEATVETFTPEQIACCQFLFGKQWSKQAMREEISNCIGQVEQTAMIAEKLAGMNSLPA